MNQTIPHLVIIGGGFAGIELVKQLKNQPIRITLIDKNNYHTFQPLLYQVASGGLGPDAIAYPLRKIIHRANSVTFKMANVLSIDTKANFVKTDIGDFPYDYLCIATGAKTNFYGNTNLEANSMQLKSIPDALDLRSNILQQFEKASQQISDEDREKVLTFVVVGGGPTGVETAGALAEMKRNVLPADYPELNKDKMKVYLIESSNRLLASMSEASSKGAYIYLNQLGVQVILNKAVKDYDASIGELLLTDQSVIKTNTLVWSAGVQGNNVLGIESQKIGKGNRYLVDEFNLVTGYDNIFAIGDVCIQLSDSKYPNGHPMVAPVAIQQAQLLAKNLIRVLKKQPLKPFIYFDKGSMATVGRHKAVFESFGIKLQGFVAWLGWMFLHLMLLVGYRNRLIVFINWMWNYFSYQRAIRIITRPYVKGKKVTS